MAAADLTGDGELDIVTANYGSANVSVLLNDGNHSFSNQQTFATDMEPVETVVADLNGDGRPDLIIPSNHDSAIGVLLGKGDGAFRAGSGQQRRRALRYTVSGRFQWQWKQRQRRPGPLRGNPLSRRPSGCPRHLCSAGGPQPRQAGAGDHGAQDRFASYAVASADAHFDPSLSTDEVQFTVSIYAVILRAPVTRWTAFASTTRFPPASSAATTDRKRARRLGRRELAGQQRDVALQTGVRAIRGAGDGAHRGRCAVGYRGRGLERGTDCRTSS